MAQRSRPQPQAGRPVQQRGPLGGYAKMMLMSGMTPTFCAAQPGHSVGMLLSTYARWLDGEHNAMEMGRLEASLRRHFSPDLSQNRRRWQAAQR